MNTDLIYAELSISQNIIPTNIVFMSQIFISIGNG